MNYNEPTSSMDKACREMRAHERSVSGCYEELMKLEGLICHAGELLAPVVLPSLPVAGQPGGNAAPPRPASSEAVSAVDGVCARVQDLNERLSNLLSRVHV